MGELEEDGSDDEIVPAAATRIISEGSKEDEFGAKDYRGLLSLRQDHHCRPLWVVSTSRLLGVGWSSIDTMTDLRLIQ